MAAITNDFGSDLAHQNLEVSHFKGEAGGKKLVGATRSWMLRAAPGWRVMRPARSRVSTIWWTEGAPASADHQ